MSVPRAAFLIHAFVVGRVEKYFISPVSRLYKTRRNFQPVFLNDNHLFSTESNRFVSSIIANKYKYDQVTGR
jgi:hypothetical protein